MSVSISSFVSEALTDTCHYSSPELDRGQPAPCQRRSTVHRGGWLCLCLSNGRRSHSVRSDRSTQSLLSYIFPRQNAPWGLGRLSNDEPLENRDARSRTFTYTFPESAGEGVTAYIIDTGIRVTHVSEKPVFILLLLLKQQFQSEFTGRVSTLQVNARLGTVDRVGHGTHVA